MIANVSWMYRAILLTIPDKDLHRFVGVTTPTDLFFVQNCALLLKEGGGGWGGGGGGGGGG